MFFTRNKERRKRNREYRKELKELQNSHMPEKWDRVVNKNAKRDWLPFIKYDYNWDWEFIIGTLIYKIELTKLYIKYFGNTIEEQKNKQIASMEEAIRLYKVFDETDWYAEERAFTDQHVTHYIFLKENLWSKDYKYIIPTGRDSLMCYDVDAVFFAEEKKKAEAYALAAGVPKEALYDKSLDKCFGARWDSREDEKYGQELSKQAERNKQKALDKFFLYVSKHIREWWD